VSLVLQCAVCGTHHPVGATVCATCHATGVQNLRFLFECPKCFRLGLTPACEVCDPPAPLPPYELVEDAEAADQFVPARVVTDGEADEFELSLDDEDEMLRLDDDDPDLSLDGE
jgi:hypothetical protein